MRELRPNLWHWEAPHPAWEPTEPWSENVSSYAIDDGERLLLFDPLARPQAERHPSSTTEAERRMVFPSGSSTIAKRSFGVTLYGAQWPT